MTQLLHGFTELTEFSAGIGANTLEFAKANLKVSAYELDPETVECLQSNLQVAGVADKVEIRHRSITEDFEVLRGQVAFIDPPWGGREYKYGKHLVNLAYGDVPVPEILENIASRFKLVVLKAPLNIDGESYQLACYRYRFTCKFCSVLPDGRHKPIYQLLFFSNSPTPVKIPRELVVQPARYRSMHYRATQGN